VASEAKPGKVSGSTAPTQPPPAPPLAFIERRHPATNTVRTVRFEMSPTMILTLVLVVAGLWLLVRLAPILLVLVVALLIVGTLSPAVSWLEAHRVRRNFGIAFVFTLVSLATFLLVTLTIPSLVAQLATLFEREPAFRAGMADYLARFHLSAPLADWLRNLKYDAPGSSVGATAFTYSLRIFEIAAYGMSAIFLALYMMIDRDRLRGGLFAVIPRTLHIRLSRVMMNLETIVGAYIRGQVITCLLIGAFTFILLTACGVENAMALAVFAGIADVLPYIGAILSVGPAVIAAIGHSPTAAVIVLVSMLAYEEFESRVLVPRIYGRALRLPSSVVLFALMVGGTLMGLLGALLALPVAATIMMLIEELRVELPGEQEQVADTELRARDDLAEEEYERRTEGVGAEQAAAIAVEMSVDRKFEESHPAEPEIHGNVG
jgi:predicted PurR-regulated permease PerM